jgi:hypothetical protein
MRCRKFFTVIALIPRMHPYLEIALALAHPREDFALAQAQRARHRRQRSRCTVTGVGLAEPLQGQVQEGQQ